MAKQRPNTEGSMMGKGLNAEIINMNLRDGIISWLDASIEKQLWAYKTYKKYVDLCYRYVHPYVEKRLKVLEVRPYHIQRICQ